MPLPFAALFKTVGSTVASTGAEKAVTAAFTHKPNNGDIDQPSKTHHPIDHTPVRDLLRRVFD